MKIRGWAAVTALVCLLSSCAGTGAATDGQTGQDRFSEQNLAYRKESGRAFSRAVWVSYLDLMPLITADRSGFESQIDAMLDNLATISATDLFFQVRAFGDSLYPSSVYPSASHTVYANLSGSFDYFQIVLEKAHARGIRVHAWVNLYRLHSSQSANYQSFVDGLKQQDANAVASVGERRVLNPASEAVRRLIMNGITELLDYYDIDGIHLDDYFYQTTDAAYDEAYYTAYRGGGGDQTREDWRRGNITGIIRQIHDAVKAKNPDIEFGISPNASVERNYSQYYLDVELLCREPGIIDYICPQIYFGYQNQSMPFLPTVSSWAGIATGCRLMVGLSYYKVGANDGYAGTGGSEWLESFDIISRQYLDSIEISNCSGVAFFRYGSIFQPSEEVATFAGLELYNLRQAIG